MLGVVKRKKQKHKRSYNIVIIIMQLHRERKEEGIMAMATMREMPRSPEAKLGMRVEDLWDVQEAQLSPTDKLNACFESIPVSAFPLPASNQGSLVCVYVCVCVCVCDFD